MYSSSVICPLQSSHERAARHASLSHRRCPSSDNGLRKPSQIMVDKTQTVSRGKISRIIGRLNDDALLSIERALAVFLGFG